METALTTRYRRAADTYPWELLGRCASQFCDCAVVFASKASEAVPPPVGLGVPPLCIPPSLDEVRRSEYELKSVSKKRHKRLYVSKVDVTRTAMHEVVAALDGDAGHESQLWEPAAEPRFNNRRSMGDFLGKRRLTEPAQSRERAVTIDSGWMLAKHFGANIARSCQVFGQPSSQRNSVQRKDVKHVGRGDKSIGAVCVGPSHALQVSMSRNSPAAMSTRAC